jgi:hypothetical protein
MIAKTSTQSRKDAEKRRESSECGWHICRLPDEKKGDKESALLCELCVSAFQPGFSK